MTQWGRWRRRFGPRAVVRALRGRPSTNAGDLLLRAHAFDPEYYRAQLGAVTELARRGDRDLVRSYRERGVHEDLAPHPLLEPSFATAAGRPGREPVSARLRRRGMRAPHPLLDLRLWTAAHPAAAEHRYGALGHLLEVLDADTVLPVDARWGMPDLRYGDYRRRVLSAVRAGADRPPAVRPDAPPLVGAVVEAADDPVGTALRALRLATLVDEVVVSTTPDQRAARRVLQACVGLQPRIVVATGTDGSPAAPDAPVVLLPGPGTDVLDAAAVTRLAERLVRSRAEDSPALGLVAPLRIDVDGQLVDAGLAWLDDAPLPYPVLAGHPPDDAGPDARVHDVAAVSPAPVLLPVDVARLVGALQKSVEDTPDGALDLIEICLQVRESGYRVGLDHSVVVRTPPESLPADARRAHGPRLDRFRSRWGGAVPAPDHSAWRSAGLEVATTSGPGCDRPTLVVTQGPLTGHRRARGRLSSAAMGGQTAAPLGRRGDIWGDSAFADDLARALRRLGQHVVVDRAEAHDRATSHLDDVVLVLRGLAPVTTPPGPCRVLWGHRSPRTRYVHPRSPRTTWLSQRGHCGAFGCRSTAAGRCARCCRPQTRGAFGPGRRSPSGPRCCSWAAPAVIGSGRSCATRSRPSCRW